MMGSVSSQLSAMMWNITNRLRLIDVIDIALLAFLIYTLMTHTKQTRVSQIIKGVVVMLAAWWLSDVLGMRTIHALLGWIINAGPVMLLVLSSRKSAAFWRSWATTPFWTQRPTEKALAAPMRSLRKWCWRSRTWPAAVWAR